MKYLLVLIIITAAALVSVAQPDLDNMVQTEKAFAASATEQGTRAAFLAHMTSDALIYVPDQTMAKPYWRDRVDDASRLVRAPNYADISSNGIIGYTTGNWELQRTGVVEEPSAFGSFVTIWLRQPDGTYKWVVNVGVSHDPPAKFITEWTTSAEKVKDLNEKRISASDSAVRFFALAAERGLAKAYEESLTNDARGFREGKPRIDGKKSLVSLAKADKAKYDLSKKSTFFETADLAYSTNTYTKKVDGRIVEKGNTLHIWKLVRGQWRIVVDVFKPVPGA